MSSHSSPEGLLKYSTVAINDTFFKDVHFPAKLKYRPAYYIEDNCMGINFSVKVPVYSLLINYS